MRRLPVRRHPSTRFPTSVVLSRQACSRSVSHRSTLVIAAVFTTNSGCVCSSWNNSNQSVLLDDVNSDVSPSTILALRLTSRILHSVSDTRLCRICFPSWPLAPTIRMFIRFCIDKHFHVPRGTNPLYERTKRDDNTTTKKHKGIIETEEFIQPHGVSKYPDQTRKTVPKRGDHTRKGIKQPPSHSIHPHTNTIVPQPIQQKTTQLPPPKQSLPLSKGRWRARSAAPEGISGCKSTTPQYQTDSPQQS